MTSAYRVVLKPTVVVIAEVIPDDHLTKKRKKRIEVQGKWLLKKNDNIRD